jgi:regulator of protease activity HflC (stomatin/prohibitin superfamily)
MAAGITFIVLIVIVILLAASLKVVKEYERGVVFRLGRVVGARGPGLIVLVPVLERMTKVNLQVITLDLEPQDVITKDNVTISVNAVLYFKVIDPVNAVVAIQDYFFATNRIAEGTLRATLGQHELDELLSHRDRINEQLQSQIDQLTEAWGIKVVSVEVKDVDLPDTMRRAMAKQAEAERERRAKIIAAEGEYQASERLRQAADRLESPTALQLRLFQTLAEISSEQSSTVILPVPIDLFRPYLEAHSTNGASKPPHVRRREEAEAERRYEETVGQARSEQQAMQDLEPDGTNPPRSPIPGEDVTAPGELPPDAGMPGEERPPSEETLRPGPS